MALLDFLNSLGGTMRAIGSAQQPQVQAGILAQMEAERAEKLRRENFNRMLGGLLQPQGETTAAGTNPPIQSAYAAPGGLLDQQVRDPSSPVTTANYPPKPPRAPGQPRGLLQPETPEPGMQEGGLLPGLSGGGSGLLANAGNGLTPEQVKALEMVGPEIGTPFLLNRMFREPPKQERPRIVTGPDGVPYFETGEQVLPGVKGPEKAPDMRQDAAGYWRYTTGPQKGQRVFPGVEKPSDTKDDAVNIRLPDGALTPGYERGGRLYYLDRDNQFKPAPFGASKAGVALSGTEANADKIRTRKFHEYEDAASDFNRLGMDIVRTIDTGTPLFGTTGWLVQTANSWRAQAEQIGRSFGGDREAAEILQRMQPGSNTWDRMRKVVGDRTDVLGAGIALAYSRAKLLDPTGRVSDADLENSVRSLGFDTNDPEIIRNSIIREMNFMKRAYEDRARRNSVGSQEKFSVPGNKQDAKRKRLMDRYGLE